MCPFGQFYPMSSFEKIAFKFVFDKSHVDRGKLHHLKHKKKKIHNWTMSAIMDQKSGKIRNINFLFFGSPALLNRVAL